MTLRIARHLSTAIESGDGNSTTRKSLTNLAFILKQTVMETRLVKTCCTLASVLHQMLQFFFLSSLVLLYFVFLQRRESNEATSKLGSRLEFGLLFLALSDLTSASLAGRALLRGGQSWSSNGLWGFCFFFFFLL